jgi:hypothetical protein
MPIVYVHGVAERDQRGEVVDSTGNVVLDRLLQTVKWSTVETNLRRFIAPKLSTSPDTVSLFEAYWGDLAARLAWDGLSFNPANSVEAEELLSFPGASQLRSWFISDFRLPVSQLIARFIGDVFCYLSKRGDAERPGAIPLRVLTKLLEAQATSDRTGEPLIVLTNSMGCEIMYDIITHFLPNVPEYSHIKVDYWCAVASQVGLFEELKLFLCSSEQYGKSKNNRVPFPDRRHLGIWWNVWDLDDLISYSVAEIIEGVDDTPFRVGQPLLTDHVGYLQEDRFYKMFADRVRNAFPRGDVSD